MTLFSQNRFSSSFYSVWEKRGVITIAPEELKPSKEPVILSMVVMGGTPSSTDTKPVLAVSADAYQGNQLLGSYRGVSFEGATMYNEPSITEETLFEMPLLAGLMELNDSFDYFHTNLREAAGEGNFYIMGEVPERFSPLPILFLERDLNEWDGKALKRFYGLVIRHIEHRDELMRFRNIMFGAGYKLPDELTEVPGIKSWDTQSEMLHHPSAMDKIFRMAQEKNPLLERYKIF